MITPCRGQANLRRRIRSTHRRPTGPDAATSSSRTDDRPPPSCDTHTPGTSTTSATATPHRQPPAYPGVIDLHPKDTHPLQAQHTIQYGSCTHGCSPPGRSYGTPNLREPTRAPHHTPNPPHSRQESHSSRSFSGIASRDARNSLSVCARWLGLSGKARTSPTKPARARLAVGIPDEIPNRRARIGRYGAVRGRRAPACRYPTYPNSAIGPAMTDSTPHRPRSVCRTDHPYRRAARRAGGPRARSVRDDPPVHRWQRAYRPGCEPSVRGHLAGRSRPGRPGRIRRTAPTRLQLSVPTACLPHPLPSWHSRHRAGTVRVAAVVGTRHLIGRFHPPSCIAPG